MHPWKTRLKLTLGTLAVGAASLITTPINLLATDAIDPATQPHLKSWSNVIPVAKRFVVLPDFNNEAVLDRETGLVWELSPDQGFRTWSDALRHCANRVVGGRFGFRLPSMPELASLLTNVPNPTIPSYLPAGHPFLNVMPSAYRSATTDASVPTNAWAVSIGGGVVGTGSKVDPDPAWCVRGPINADNY